MKYIVNGGRPLEGTVRVGGSKNAVLPILCACVLCSEGTVTLNNCPDISDVTYTLCVLERLGCIVSVHGEQITVNAQNASYRTLDCDEMSRLRSTALFLGAVTGRFGRAEQCLPGGCELGARPIDLHLLAFSAMGLDVALSGGIVSCRGCAHGADIFLKFPSVGATENIMLAAALGKGTVTITGAAREPEVVDLQNFINAMGGNIRGAGTDIIIVEGVEKLSGITYNIINDRIEAATYMTAALVTGGNVRVEGVCLSHILAFTDLAVSCGGSCVFSGDSVTVGRACPRLFADCQVDTAPFPGFATDTQSLALSLLSVCHGKSVVCENIFSDRLRLAGELCRMGADITVHGNRAYINGVSRLYGASVRAFDLRSGAALVVSALGACGRSEISDIHHIFRGYRHFDDNLRALGADIIMTKD